MNEAARPPGREGRAWWKIKERRDMAGRGSGPVSDNKKVLISVAKGFIDIGIVRERRMNGVSSVRDNFLQLQRRRRAGGEKSVWMDTPDGIGR